MHSQATASGLALSVYQYLYLEPQQEINGTMDAEILQKEKLSVKSPYFHIDNLEVERGSGDIQYVPLDF